MTHCLNPSRRQLQMDLNCAYEAAIGGKGFLCPSLDNQAHLVKQGFTPRYFCKNPPPDLQQYRIHNLVHRILADVVDAQGQLVPSKAVSECQFRKRVCEYSDASLVRLYQVETVALFHDVFRSWLALRAAPGRRLQAPQGILESPGLKDILDAVGRFSGFEISAETQRCSGEVSVGQERYRFAIADHRQGTDPSDGSSRKSPGQVLAVDFLPSA